MRNIARKALKQTIYFTIMMTFLTLFAQTGVHRPGFTTVNPFGNCESASAFSFTFSGNDLAIASPASPIYIQLSLTQGVRLCQTLVWDNDANSDDTTRAPIHLVVSLQTTQTQPKVTVTAPADSVSIVRWKAGEDQIWLRIDRSSNDWLSTGEVTDDTKVSFSFGATATNDAHYYADLFAQGHANLEAPTRSGLNTLADTSLRLDLTGIPIESDPNNPGSSTGLAYQILSSEAGHATPGESPEAAGDASDIVVGQAVDLFFNIPRTFARAWLPQRARDLLERAPDWQTGTVTLLDMVDFLNQEVPYDACEFNLTP